MAEIVVYVVMVFFAPVAEEPFGSIVAAREFDSLEACAAAMHTVIADAVAPDWQAAVRGGACVTPGMAAAISDAQDRLTP